jgi:hypothetical protein
MNKLQFVVFFIHSSYVQNKDQLSITIFENCNLNKNAIFLYLKRINKHCMPVILSSDGNHFIQLWLG